MNKPIILHIETSTEVCSVALSSDEQCLCVKESTDGRNHAALLTVLIEELFDTNDISASMLNAVAISSGPGSYTGLRIGTSVAKGVCYGANIPLVAVSTLHAMSMGFIQLNGDIPQSALLCPMIDARRMEVYTALYDQKGSIVENISAKIITEHSFSSWLEEYQIYFFGNGSNKCRSSIKHYNAIFCDNFTHSSRYMLKPALQAYNEKIFEDVAYFEPFYLKDFIAGPIKSGKINC